MKIKQGISLIVLVITIIVMTILAGAIILTLNNSGIINKATDAVEQSNLATVKELTQMAWAEAYAGGERTQEGLKTAVDKALEDNKVDEAKYIIEVTTSGVTVELKGEAKWVQQGLTVTNGTVTLEIGDSIAYDETNGGKETGLTATDWKVLGASEEGELLIMSTSDVDNIELGAGTFEENQKEWLYGGVTKLDTLSKAYGKGTGAIGARSIRLEDLDKITGFDKTTYGKGRVDEYGNEVTYSYVNDGMDEPEYTSTNGTSGHLYMHFGEFHYYNGTDFVLVNLSDTIDKIVTIKNNLYTYGIGVENLEEKSKVVEMIFGEFDEYLGDYPAVYWLASTFVACTGGELSYGMYSLALGSVNYNTLWNSVGTPLGGPGNMGVRAVVTLASDINITGNSESGWSIK